MKKLIRFVLGFVAVSLAISAVDSLPISDLVRGYILLLLALTSIAIVVVLGLRGNKHD